jgi:hypothetical protein
MPITPSRIRFSFRQALAAVGVIAVSMSGCATESGKLETPQGSRPGDQFAGYEILGVSNRLTTTLNRTNGDLYGEDLTLNVPVGTQPITGHP